jgi:DNA primase
MTVKLALLPEGEDPDSYAKQFGGQGLSKYFYENAQDFVEFKTTLAGDKSKTDPIEKVKLINEIMQSIALIPDGITREVYLDKCSKLLDIAKSELENKVYEIKNKAKRSTRNDKIVKKKVEEPQALTKKRSKSDFQEKDIIRFMMQYGHYTLNFESEEENEEENKIYVVQYIISELEKENVFFKSSLQLYF